MRTGLVIMLKTFELEAEVSQTNKQTKSSSDDFHFKSSLSVQSPRCCLSVSVSNRFSQASAWHVEYETHKSCL